MERIDAILVCERGHIFNGRDMLAPCPECGGKFVQASTEDHVRDCLIDAEVMDMLMETNTGDDIIMILEDRGWNYDPTRMWPDRLIEISGAEE
jgi:predicted  nucleic acid-binding Zn-ribbon protein